MRSRPAPGHHLLRTILAAALSAFGILVPVAAASASFGPPTSFQVGLEPTSIAIADFDEDDVPDMAVANWDSHFISILLGDGDGSFGPASNVGALAQPSDPGAFPRSVATGDLNGDGFEDVVIGRGGIGLTPSVAVLLGNGNGTFAPLTRIPASGTDPWAVLIDDFDGDGLLDIASANRVSDTVSVIPGNGDGTFDAATTYPVGVQPHSIASGDLNGDSDPDLVTSNMNSDNVSVLLSDGAGSFSPAASYPMGPQPYALTVGNIDGNGRPDIAVIDYQDDNTSILLNDGNGSFGPRTTLNTGDGPSSVAIANLGGTSAPDLAIANSDANNVVVLEGDGAGGFGDPTGYTAGNVPGFVTVGKLNQGTTLDLAVANESSNNVSILLNTNPEPTLAATAVPSTLEFGEQLVGRVSGVRTVTISNDQASPLPIEFAGIAGTMQDDFNFVSSSCEATILPVGGECEVGISFAPSVTGVREAWLEIFPDGPGTPLSVPLSGRGVSPIDPDEPKLGRVTVTGPIKVKWGRPATWKVRVPNPWNVTITGVRLRVSGKGVAFNASVGRIAAGTARTVKVRLRPKKVGRIRATFRVTSANAGSKTVRKVVTVRK
jgi:hypothetical protein